VIPAFLKGGLLLWPIFTLGMLGFAGGASAQSSRAGEELPVGPLSQSDPNLSQLDQILRESDQPLKVHLCFAGGQNLGEAQIAQGAALTQALALHAGYRPLLISHGAQLETGKFNVLVGTVDQLRNYISPEDMPRIVKGYLAIQYTRGGRGGFYLFVAGQTPEDIQSVALDLGELGAPLPESSSAFVSPVVPPNPAHLIRQEPIQPEKTVTLAQLVEGAVPMRSLPSGGVALDLFFPGYLRTDSDDHTVIDLHLSGSSSFRLRLDGHEILVASSGAGSAIGGGKSFLLPVARFEHGRNVLEIRSVPPLSQGDGRRLLANSELVTPKIKEGPKLPDLRLVSQTFYPFIGRPDGSDLSVFLAEKSHDTIDAAWTLLSRLAQSADTFFYGAQFSFEQPDAERHILAVGVYSHLPSAFRRIVALRAFQAENLNVPLSELGLFSGTNLKQGIERLLDQHEEPSEIMGADGSENQRHPSTTLDRDFGVVATARLPSAESKWSLVVTAFTEENLLYRVESLVQPGFWDQIRGDIVRWKDAPASFEAHLPGEKPQVARPSLVELPLGEKLSLPVWIGLTAVILILFVIVTWWLLGQLSRVPRLLPRQR
jgi:cellulose synthase operon protein B